jgi:hypothetical protein
MKNLLMLFVTLFVSVSAVTAQDIITLKNGDEIKAKVQEIGLSDVKYKKFENLTGPTYTLLKTEIFMIKYENGEKDVFDTGRSRSVTPTQTPTEKPARTVNATTRQETPPNVSETVSTLPWKGEPETATKRDRKVKFGILAGLAVANVNSENYQSGGYYSDWDVSPRFGFTGGVLLEFKLSKWFSIQPEFLITMKGCKREGYTDLYNVNDESRRYIDAYEEWNVNFTYLELPLHFTLNIPVKKDFIHVGAGPYVAYGIFGKSRSHFSYHGRDIDDEMIDEALESSLFSGERKHYSPLDWGVHCFAEYAFSDMYLIRAGYSFGLGTIDDGGDVSVKNNYFHISFGFKF